MEMSRKEREIHLRDYVTEKTMVYFFHNFTKLFFVSYFLPPLMKYERERGKFLLGVMWSKIWYQI